MLVIRLPVRGFLEHLDPPKRAAARTTLFWLLNGGQIGRVPTGHALHQQFSVAGPCRTTVLEDAGRYDRVEISLR